MSYFLGFLALLGLVGLLSVVTFVLGRPLPGTLRIASSAEMSYIASLLFGFIFAINNLCKTVFFSISSSAAISLIVIPVIVFISVNIHKKLDIFKRFLNKKIIQIKHTKMLYDITKMLCEISKNSILLNKYVYKYEKTLLFNQKR